MLGWFKKAFGKKPVDQPVNEPELVDQSAGIIEVSASEESSPDGSIPQLTSEIEESLPVEVGVEVEIGLAESESASNETEPVTVAAHIASPSPESEELTRGEVIPPSDEPEPVAAEPAAEVTDSSAVQDEATADMPSALSVEEATPQDGGEAIGLLKEPAAAGEELPALETLDQATPDQDENAEAQAEPEPSLDPPSSHTQEKPGSKSMFKRLQERLGKTRDALVYRLDRLFLGKKEIDQDLFEQLEEILITSDLGVATTLELLDRARKKVKRDQLNDPQALKIILRDQILAYIEATEQPAELVMPAEGPFVLMVVGVNGVGKTTTIGKIAAKFVRSGQSVLLIAADTFRAAAINQLKIWGERVGVPVIAQNPGADPSSVVFDGLEHGLTHHYDVIIVDTAGRLHTSVNLMAELKKIKRVIGKKLEGAPHEVMLVLDATTGQNGIAQAKMFHEAVGVSGLTLTKLDGTAKGGIVANICREIKIPVRFIGIGEQLDDLRDFEAREFVDALFALPSE